MAKGKNKAIAERRVTALAEIGTIDALKLRIKNLEEELAEVKSRAEEVNALKNQNIAELNQKLRDNTSAEVEELRGIVVGLRDQMGKERLNMDKVRKQQQKMVSYLLDHFEKDHKMSRTDALSKTVWVSGEDGEFSEGGPLIVDDDLLKKLKAGKLTPEQARIMQIKRKES
jgi:hypothetical protein